MLSMLAYVQTRWAVHFKYVLCSLSRVPLLVMLCTVARQTPLSVGFFWQVYWSGLPFSSSRGSSWPRGQTWLSCGSCTAGRFFTFWAAGEALNMCSFVCQFHLSKVFLFKKETQTEEQWWQRIDQITKNRALHI